MNQYTLTYKQVAQLGSTLAMNLRLAFPALKERRIKAYGVPRGGICAVLACSAQFDPVTNIKEADVVMDDIIDSGKTRDAHRASDYGKVIPFVALIDKTSDTNQFDGWVTFPWEVAGDVVETAEGNFGRILQAIGENPKREGLIETPKRFIKALREMTSGLHEDPKVHLHKAFTLADGAEAVTMNDEIILSRDIPFVSLCEHHFLAFDGIAHIAYLPNLEGGKVVGLSKLARVLDGYAKRPQVQERLTSQIADAIEEVLAPRGVAVIIKARHTCQCMRGIKKDGRMVTSAMRGVFKEDARTRAELFELIKL